MPCHYHLAQRLDQALRAQGVIPPRDAGQWRNPNPPPRRSPNTLKRELRVKASQPGWYDTNRVALRDYPEPEKHPLVVASRRAFRSVEQWDALHVLAERWQAGNLLAFMRREAWMRDAVANHPDGIPRSIGGLENQLARVRTLLRDRRLVLRNQQRTQHLLDLMTLSLRGLGNTDDYAARIRAHLSEHGGRPPLQRVGITGGPQLY